VGNGIISYLIKNKKLAGFRSSGQFSEPKLRRGKIFIAVKLLAK